MDRSLLSPGPDKQKGQKLLRLWYRLPNCPQEGRTSFPPGPRQCRNLFAGRALPSTRVFRGLGTSCQALGFHLESLVAQVRGHGVRWDLQAVGANMRAGRPLAGAR